jgi:beta-glucanase (GH16 family)
MEIKSNLFLSVLGILFLCDGCISKQDTINQASKLNDLSFVVKVNNKLQYNGRTRVGSSKEDWTVGDTITCSIDNNNDNLCYLIYKGNQYWEVKAYNNNTTFANSSGILSAVYAEHMKYNPNNDYCALTTGDVLYTENGSYSKSGNLVCMDLNMSKRPISKIIISKVDSTFWIDNCSEYVKLKSLSPVQWLNTNTEGVLNKTTTINNTSIFYGIIQPDNNATTIKLKNKDGIVYTRTYSGKTMSTGQCIGINGPLSSEAAQWTCNIDPAMPDTAAPKEVVDSMQLIWHDEFSTNGPVNSDYWIFEKGFVRNQELQWYQSDNAVCDDGALVITGKKEQIKNPNYVSGSSSWKTNRQYAQYTSSSMTTCGKFSFKYGRILVRAKIPVASGSWPAIWTLGNWYEWPSCGEIDLMEFYGSSIHANTCWGSNTEWSGNWNSVVKPLSYFTSKDQNWTSKYHIWKMDWDDNVIRIYLDDELMNVTYQANTQNGSAGGDGAYKYPFKQAQYVLLNLAIGANGGTPDDSAFPLKYYIDYVRVYQKK